MMNLICLRDLILFLIYEIILNISSKNETIADNPSGQIYVNKIKNRIIFKIKTGYKLLTEETMQLFGSSKKEFAKNKDGEIVPRLETLEVVLVHCNSVNNNY